MVKFETHHIVLQKHFINQFVQKKATTRFIIKLQCNMKSQYGLLTERYNLIKSFFQFQNTIFHNSFYYQLFIFPSKKIQSIPNEFQMINSIYLRVNVKTM